MTRQIAEQLFTSPSDQGNSAFEHSGARISRRGWGRWLSVLIVALTLSPLGFTAPPDGKGKGGGGGEDPPTFPFDVRYRLHWLDENGVPEGFPMTRVFVKDMNNSGFVVGNADNGYPYDHKRAYCYDYQSGAFIDVNDLSQTWIDLEVDPDDENRTPTNWIAIEAWGTNESGEIVGSAQNSDTHEIRAFLLHYPEGVPQFGLLPKVGDGDNKGMSINDVGVVIADGQGGSTGYLIVYTPPYLTPTVFDVSGSSGATINNLGEISLFGGGYGTVSGNFTQYENRKFWEINNWGQLAGQRLASGKGKNAIPGGTIRRNPNGSEEFLGGGAGFGINDDGDVVIADSGQLWMDEYGAMRLVDLVVNAGSNTVLRYPRRISNRDATGFGLISGGDLPAGAVFILVPFVPEN